MSLSADKLRAALDALCKREPALAAAVDRAGYPEPRIRARGYATLLRTIIGQQVSTKAAAIDLAQAGRRSSAASTIPAISRVRPTSSFARPACRDKRPAMRAALRKR